MLLCGKTTISIQKLWSVSVSRLVRVWPPIHSFNTSESMMSAKSVQQSVGRFEDPRGCQPKRDRHSHPTGFDHQRPQVSPGILTPFSNAQPTRFHLRPNICWQICTLNALAAAPTIIYVLEPWRSAGYVVYVGIPKMSESRGVSYATIPQCHNK